MNDNLGMSYYNIARLLFRMRHYNESLKAYHKFLRTEKSEELETVTHKSLTCMAKCYLKVAKYKKALECVDRGLKYIQVRPSLQYWVHNFKDLKVKMYNYTIKKLFCAWQFGKISVLVNLIHKRNRLNDRHWKINGGRVNQPMTHVICILRGSWEIQITTCKGKDDIWATIETLAHS